MQTLGANDRAGWGELPGDSYSQVTSCQAFKHHTAPTKGFGGCTLLGKISRT